MSAGTHRYTKASPSSETNMIDSHVHVWTDDAGKYPRIASIPQVEPRRFTPEDYFEHARPSGVTRTVLVQMSFYGYDNSYMLDSLRTYPHVFSGIAVVDSHSPRPEANMLSLASLGVRGFRIQPGKSSDPWLDNSGMHSMWTCGAEHHLALCALINPADLRELDRMCTQHPDTPVVIDHLARIGADGPVTDDAARSLCALAKHRNVFVGEFSVLLCTRPQAGSVHRSRPPHPACLRGLSSKTLMWGLDCPFQVQAGHVLSSSAALIQDHLPFTTPEERSVAPREDGRIGFLYFQLIVEHLVSRLSPGPAAFDGSVILFDR